MTYEELRKDVLSEIYNCDTISNDTWFKLKDYLEKDISPINCFNCTYIERDNGLYCTFHEMEAINLMEIENLSTFCCNRYKRNDNKPTK